MRTTKRFNNQKRRGIATLWVIVFAMVLVVFIAMVVSVAQICLTRHQLNNVADAAALAGSRYVAWDPNSNSKIAARKMAQDYANLNQAAQLAVNLDLNVPNRDENPDAYGNSAGDIVIGRYAVKARTFTPSQPSVYEAPNAMKVVARKDGKINEKLPLIFGPMFGLDRFADRQYAIAMILGHTGAGLIALAPDGDPGLYLNGDFALDVDGGAIQVNSELVSALEIDGTAAEIRADEINIVGEFDTSKNFDYPVDHDGSPVPINAAPDVEVDPIPDPLCPGGVGTVGCVPEPDYSGMPDLSPKDPNTGLATTWKITGGNVTIPAGYYSGGFEITGGNVSLEPGIYHLGGGAHPGKGGLVVGGSANLTADGVMFHLLPDHTNPDLENVVAGKVDIAGTGNVHITPIDIDNSDGTTDNDTDVISYPDPANYNLSTYDSIAIFQSRTNYRDAKIVGTSVLDLDGTLYFPENHLDLRGEGDGFGNQLIAWTIDVRGSGTITIEYEGDEPAVATRSILVE